MHQLISLKDIAEGEAKSAKYDGESYLVVNFDNSIYVYRNRCPHLGIPLEWQENDFLEEGGDLIRCATHGALFTIEDGLCVSGPCNGEFLTAVQHRIEDGNVLIDENR